MKDDNAVGANRDGVDIDHVVHKTRVGPKLRIKLVDTALSPPSFSDRQLAIGFKAKRLELEQARRELRSAEDDLSKYLKGLMFDLYAAKAEGRVLTVSQACELIPAKHNETCKKYLDLAVVENFILIEESTVDHRKKVVTPTEKLLRFVEEEAEQKCGQLKMLVDEFALAG